MTFVLRSKVCGEASSVKITGRNYYRQGGGQIPKPQGDNLYGIVQDAREELKHKEQGGEQMGRSLKSQAGIGSGRTFMKE